MKRPRRVSHFAVFFASFVVSVTVLAGLILPPDSTQFMTAGIAPLPTAARAWPYPGCTYLVRPGDNLFRIGLRYGVSYLYLAQLNGIANPNLIYAGWTIAVPCGSVPGPFVPPANCAASQTYQVVAGDNLFRIAYNFKTSLNLVRSANSLYGRVLRPGMQLTIPCPGSVQYREVPPPSGTGAPPPTSQPPPATVNPNTVTMQNNTFNPQTENVRVGTTVTWINDETNGTHHTVKCSFCPSNVPFGSGDLAPGQTYSFTFDSLGRFDYTDPNVPGMAGTVSVTQ